MNCLLTRWRRICRPRSTRPAWSGDRPDYRPVLAQVMCRPCARRWLAGHALWHPGCGKQLRNAFDLYFERLYEDP